MNTQPQPKKRERVGVILVHGIGEQKRFKHLDSHGRQFIQAVIDRQSRTKKVTECSFEIQTGQDSPFPGSHDTWVSAWGPAVRALVRHYPEQAYHPGARQQSWEVDDGMAPRGPLYETEISIHEVWWADLAVLRRGGPSVVSPA